MTSTETEQQAAGLPMVVEAQRERPSLRRSQTTAAFVSQLLAARQNLAAQRVRRLSSAADAVNAYRTGAAVGVVRMPQGYRKTVVV